MTRASGVSIVSTGILFTKSLTYRILKKTGSLSCSSSALQKIDTGLRGWCLRALAMFSCNRPFQSCGLLWREEYYIVEKILKGILDSIPSPSHSVRIQFKGRKVSQDSKMARELSQKSLFVIKTAFAWSHIDSK